MLSFTYLQAAISHGIMFMPYTVSMFFVRHFPAVLSSANFAPLGVLGLHILQTPKHTLQVNSSNDYN